MARINIIVPLPTVITLEAYGYTSHGYPEIKLYGLGKAGQIIKEKIKFVSRVNNVRPPFKRYYLIVEISDRLCQLSFEESRWLELPLLLLYWNLVGAININHMENCYTYGMIDASLDIIQNKKIHKTSLEKISGQNKALISVQKPNLNQEIRWLDLKQILAGHHFEYKLKH